jgi:hypothetical protein
MAQMAFGDPGFFDFIARGFKTIAPALSFGASFIPGVGPFVSKAIEGAAGLVADEPQNNADRLSGDDDDGGED